MSFTREMSQSCLDDNETNNSKSQSDSLSIFCREVRNLLRSKPNCMIPFSKFVPAYHNHYGRQCCVYQFGYTKLIELLEAIPHVVQIIGDGTNRYITLTHREQIKRFASDLIKVVKSQPGKKLKLSSFARAYEQVLGRLFRLEDYGTNNINVLLAEIWEGTINIMPIKRELVDEQLVPHALFVNGTSSGRQNTGANSTSASGSPLVSNAERPSSRAASNSGHEAFILNQLVASCELVNKPYITEQYPDAWFEIPKRERSDKEIRRTKYFVWDVIELLSNMAPDYSVPFSKFIPSYHYYFNRQCKVSIFGFSKLIDLFESISPNVVEIVDQGPGEEKIIKLATQHIPIGQPTKRHLARKHPPRRQPHLIESRAGFDRRSHDDDGDDDQDDQDDDDDQDYGDVDDKLSDEGKLFCRRAGEQVDDKEEEEVGVEEEEEEVELDLDVAGVNQLGGGASARVEQKHDLYHHLHINNKAKSSRSNKQEVDESDEGIIELADDSDDDCDYECDDVILPVQAIDNGPTEEELMELEDELEAYEQYMVLQGKRSTRMAATLDVFKYSVY